MEKVTAMIECPRGYKQQFSYDQASFRFKLTAFLPEGLTFPFDFGFLPETNETEKSPKGIIVLSETPSFPGRLIDCRVIGSIAAEQTELDGIVKRHTRLVGIPLDAQSLAGVSQLSQLPTTYMRQLQNFFASYNSDACAVVRSMGTNSASMSRQLLAS